MLNFNTQRMVLLQFTPFLHSKISKLSLQMNVLQSSCSYSYLVPAVDDKQLSHSYNNTTTPRHMTNIANQRGIDLPSLS